MVILPCGCLVLLVSSFLVCLTSYFALVFIFAFAFIVIFVFSYLSLFIIFVSAPPPLRQQERQNKDNVKHSLMLWKSGSPQTVHSTGPNPDSRKKTGRVNRNSAIKISWSWNIAVAVAAIVMLLFVPLDDVQTAFSMHLIALCITCAVLVWTKGSSRNWFIFSIFFTCATLISLVNCVWNCEPVYFGGKMVMLSLYLLGLRALRIGGSRLLHAVEGTPKITIRITPVQIFLAASVVLVASLHLAFRSLEVFSFAEIALWGCCIVDTLWHFRTWKMNMKRVFRSTEGMNRAHSRKRSSALQSVNRVRKQQNVLTYILSFAEVTGMTLVICMNSVLGLQEVSKECNRRTSIGSDRIALFIFPLSVAFHICSLMVIYMHAASKWRDKQQRLGQKQIAARALIASYRNISFQSDIKGRSLRQSISNKISALTTLRRGLTAPEPEHVVPYVRNSFQSDIKGPSLRQIMSDDKKSRSLNQSISIKISALMALRRGLKAPEHVEPYVQNDIVVVSS
jgi:hypothetical protein